MSKTEENEKLGWPDLFYAEFLCLKENGANCVIFMRSGSVFHCEKVIAVKNEHVVVQTSGGDVKTHQIVKYALIDRVAYAAYESGDSIQSLILTVKKVT